ncbi:MAG: class I SAM-dependent methyltransferase [Thermoproteota archaeon]|nr:class I SAM-dependent methyltransferase [Thermoproteota archaeon]
MKLNPTKFKDLFSSYSKEYASSRPTYPRSLFGFLVGLVQYRNLAWDCATGNGQAAVFLSEYFEQVIASDASREQIENAQPKDNIRYEVFPAEKTALADNSVDLITIAQALHWFDLDDFYKEVKRVLRREEDNGSGSNGSSGVIAAWAYGLHSISTEIDNITHLLYEDILGSYWPKERKIVENKYQEIPFPFQEIDTPVFQIELDWTLSELVGYLYTWSSVQKFIGENNSDPIKQVYDDLVAAWGDKNTWHKRRVVWPIYIRVGRY